MKVLLTVLYIIFWVNTGLAQEIAATVKVDAEQVQTQERQIFKDLESNITQFLNNRKWTNDRFNSTERIKMNFTIKILKADVSSGLYEGTAIVQVIRPVYNSSYESMTLFFLDKNFNFSYLPNQTIEFNENAFITNLGSMLAFFAYIGIGIDYDTFSPLGGSAYFEKANLIANNALSGSGASEAERKGWVQFGSDPNNRYWLIENLMASPFRTFREGYYQYHRKGLDLLADDIEAGRSTLLAFLEVIRPVNDGRPNSCLMRTFFNTKDGELINIFKEAPSAEKTRVHELLKAMDPTNTENYDKILSK